MLPSGQFPYVLPQVCVPTLPVRRLWSSIRHCQVVQPDRCSIPTLCCHDT
eukprot:TRINITY_DN3068_c3_g1_i1.p4 TRINITY_DN3068_c3_g1~~TRINITY_DN3068_c3_g1_i1.p4  ORF type:complete len:50 (-),score=5.13 TRINITY_DN3068_c3_g1_i1:153-302(-)